MLSNEELEELIKKLLGNNGLYSSGISYSKGEQESTMQQNDGYRLNTGFDVKSLLNKAPYDTYNNGKTSVGRSSESKYNGLNGMLYTFKGINNSHYTGQGSSGLTAKPLYGGNTTSHGYGAKSSGASYSGGKGGSK